MSIPRAASPLRALFYRIAAIGLAGLAALLAVFSLDAQIADLAALFGASRSASDYQRRAAAAAATCGALGAERESCELSLMRLEGAAPGAPATARAGL